jgi:antitoxin component of RelBE/YafQ-DinJ toxin-antitoxin module
MTSKVIFNIDSSLKNAAMKKAQKEGLTLSAVLTMTTRAFVDNTIKIGVFERELGQALGEMRQGKKVPAAEVYKKLGIN